MSEVSLAMSELLRGPRKWTNRGGDEEIGSLNYLCSEAARYITGQVIYVDGGTLARL